MSSNWDRTDREKAYSADKKLYESIPVVYKKETMKRLGLEGDGLKKLREFKNYIDSQFVNDPRTPYVAFFEGFDWFDYLLKGDGCSIGMISPYVVSTRHDENEFYFKVKRG